MNRRLAVILGGVVLLALIAIGSGVDTVVDALWFGELGYEDVYWTSLKARLAVRRPDWAGRDAVAAAH